MFIQTEKASLMALHSLLSKPFEFNAVDSLVKGPFCKGRLKNRPDMDALSSLCALYDSSKMKLVPYLNTVRTELETIYSVRLTMEGRFREICKVSFSGEPPHIPYDIDPSDYLIHDHGQKQLERIYDFFGIRQMGDSLPCSNPVLLRIVRFLLLNDALVFAFSGLAKVDQPEPSNFRISVFDDAALDSMRRLWFSRSISLESSTADMAKLKVVASQNGKGGQQLWEMFLDNMLDKYFSIAWSRLTYTGRNLRTVKHLRGLVNVIATILTRQQNDQKVFMSRSSLIECGLDYSFVSSILERLERSLVTDVFLWRDGDKLICNPNATATVMRKYASDLATELGEVDALHSHVGGDFFEKKTIVERLRADPEFNVRYQVYDSFDRGQVLDDTVNKADVDLVLHDQQLEHYYFIQVKYTLPGQVAGFASEIKQLQNDIAYGLNQIREAKRLLENGLLMKTLAHRGIHNAHSGNCSYVLLHNIGTYDYQMTEDGIVLYEWASFRNLLRDCKVTFGLSDGPQHVAKLPSPILLSNPQNVINSLFREHPVFQGQQKNIWAMERAVTSFTVDDTQVEVSGLGI